MVLRPSSSSWSISPETIMSHHYRLTKGVRGVIDTSPPFSMHNSPISVHYIPKRASSADAVRRNQYRPQSKPHRDLSDFIASSNPLRLPLPLRSSVNDLVKPKLLQNRNYQPPLHRKKKPPLPVPSSSSNHIEVSYGNEKKRKEKRRNDRETEWTLFKDAVFTSIIDRGIYTDSIIVDTVEAEMELWRDQLTWNELEVLKEEIFDELGIAISAIQKIGEQKNTNRRKSRASSSGSVSTSKSSSSSASSSSGSGSDRSALEQSSQRSSESSSSSASSSSNSSTSEESSESETSSELSSIRD